MKLWGTGGHGDYSPVGRNLLWFCISVVIKGKAEDDERAPLRVAVVDAIELLE